MAERRMFAKTIIDSDAFIDMPLSTHALYFHLSMRADDDGFINNPKKIQRMVGASEDDLKLLIAKNFIIPFESGIVVIKHWKIHNYIRNDRYKPTMYQEEKELLEEKENKAYTLGIPDGYQMDTQVRLELGKSKISIGKDSIDNNIIIAKANDGVTKSELEEEFNLIWSEYPNKKGKANALKSYIKARKKGITYDTIFNGLQNYLKYIKFEKVAQQYIKHGSTWFNQECWNDDYTINREITTGDLAEYMDFSEFR